MAQKPISSVLEKIRKRRMEVLKKAMFPGRIQRNDSVDEIALEADPKDDSACDTSDSGSGKADLEESVAQPSAMNANPNRSPVVHLEEKATPSFRVPLNDTQDLFSDSQTSEMQADQPNKESDNLAEEHVASSLPSLNLKFDSVLPDDTSDEEESDEDNIGCQTVFKGSSSPRGDPVKEFVDEEALEDDSDNDILQFDDEECDNADAEEVRKYIANDYKEKPIDHDRRNELHQMWLQQQDEAGTENLLQRLKFGTEHRDVSVLRDDDDGQEAETDDDDDDDKDDDTEDLFPTPGVRVSTKKLKQMIPQMFTDKDDGFVSSEDEETEKKLSKQRVLQKLELEQQPKLLSPARDEASKEVFGRIKKLNTFSESKKRAKTSYSFDSLLIKGVSRSSSKSSFLQRSSSNLVTSIHRTGLSTGRSFIFGRDDSNSRSSISQSEDSSNLSQRETHTKKNPSAKFISSQPNRSTQQTETRSQASSSASLFEVLRRSSTQKGHATEQNMVDHHAVFAAFKPVKKRVKIDGRS